MKNLIYCFLFLMAMTNAFASTMVIAPTTKKAATVKVDFNNIDSLVVANCDDGSKELQVKTTADNDDAVVDMQNVRSINLANKNPDDKVTFYINGEKKTYKVSEIKSIKIRTVERAN